jgi:hypothetical protein
MGGNYFDEDSDEDGTDGEIELTDDEFENLLNAVRGQQQYHGGRIVKVKLTDEQKKKLDVLKDSKSNMQSVTVPSESKRDKCKYDVVVMKNISEAMFHSSIFPFSTPGYKHFEAEVVQGIVLGTILGKKLQIRNEEKTTLYTRKDTGRVDKRLLAEFGFGNSQVFSQSFTEKYCKAILHISIDVSGSMAGTKLGKAITTTTAICKAASMIQNLDVVVSLRGSLEGNQGRQPVIASIYDSRIDKFVKVRRWFPILTDSGLTPEGLCFAAIEKEIASSSKELQSYFLNFSDGEPYFSDSHTIQYSGDAAARHTASEVKKMQLRGVKVLSYFISDGYGDSMEQFKVMYGRSAQSINTSNMTEVARTMNKMFLSEDAKA